MLSNGQERKPLNRWDTTICRWRT